MKHLAVFRQPYLDMILNGEKTIESRFSRVKCAPYGKIGKGDIVLLKVTGGLVFGEFAVRGVKSFAHVTPELIEDLKSFSKEICSDGEPTFWEQRRDKKICYANMDRIGEKI